MSAEDRTIWCGNVSDKVTEELLFELFLQAAPIEKIRIPTDAKTGRQANYAFVTLKHDISLEYVLRLLNGIQLFDRALHVKPRNGSQAAQRMNEQQQHMSNQLSSRLGDVNSHNKNDHEVKFNERKFNNSYRDREDHSRRDDCAPYRTENRHSNYDNSPSNYRQGGKHRSRTRRYNNRY